MARTSYSERASFESSIRGKLKKFYFTTKAADRLLSELSGPQLRDLDSFLSWELCNRDENRKARIIKTAGFPSFKSLDEFIFDEVRMPPTMTREAMTGLEFLKQRDSLIFYGICGSGKTMLATALGLKACNEGYNVKFVTLSQLGTRLISALEDGRIEAMLSDFRTFDLLIIDEWGYCQLDKRSADLVFQIIADSYERRSLILTTNLPFSEWGKIVSDEQLAAAMIDRIVHHGHLVNTGNVDYRLKQSPMNIQILQKT